MRLTRRILAGLLLGLLTLIAVWRPSEPGPGALAAESVDDDESARIPILRILAQIDVARDVTSGRRSLAEAAALFGELNRLEPPATDLARLSPFDSLPTHAERLCRQVIYWVDGQMVRGGLPSDAVVARLEAELRGLKEHGPIRLPNTANRELIEDLLRHARARFAEEKQLRRTRTGPSPATH